MEDLLRSGYTLIVDRYAYSGVAYTTAKVFASLIAGVEWFEVEPRLGL
jgi:thymidylate kinase